jgi:hypothetical protein
MVDEYPVIKMAPTWIKKLFRRRYNLKVTNSKKLVSVIGGSNGGFRGRFLDR